jgi:hypothetical protein
MLFAWYHIYTHLKESIAVENFRCIDDSLICNSTLKFRTVSIKYDFHIALCAYQTYTNEEISNCIFEWARAEECIEEKDEGNQSVVA